MPASRKFLRPETLERIARLELRARAVVDGFMSGLHRSPYFGQSVEFLQHRAYAPGDDLRHLDWKAWAKQDRLYVKQYEEEANLELILVVDVSASMRYGAGRWNKYEQAATAAASLAWLALRQQDAVGCLTFADRVRQTIPPRARHTQLATIVAALEESTPAEKTELEFILRRAAEVFPRRGLVVLVSDLLAPRPGLFRGLRLLKQRGHDVLVLHVLDDDELDFPFSGVTRFEGLEETRQLTVNPRALREGYLEALEAYLEEVRRGATAVGVDYRLLRTSDSLEAPLVALLEQRAHQLRR